MPAQKVDASRHNAKAAPRNNAPSGSKPSEPPSLIGGGGSRYLEDTETYSVDSPPPIKRKDYCRDRSCGSPWTIHHKIEAIQQHVRCWFVDPDGLPYNKWGSIPRVLGVETVNEIIQVYRIKWQQITAAGKEIENHAKFFGFCRNTVEQGMEARQNPADVDKAWDALKPAKKPQADHGQKYLDEYEKRRGSRDAR